MNILPLVLLLSLVLSACGGGGSSSNTDVENQEELFIDTDGDGVADDIDDFPEDNTRAATVANAHNLLLQASFGPTESEIDRVVRIGREAWVEQQLDARSAYDSVSDDHKTHFERTVEISLTVEPNYDWYPTSKVFSTGKVFNELGFSEKVDQYQMASWWENALGHPTNTLHGKDQLRQRVAYVLSQLLVTSGVNISLDWHAESLAYYYDILAKRAFGNYRTLLGEVSRSATMGIYLSHQGNAKADPINNTRPDENYARELIQLFTIGLVELNLDSSPNRDGDIYTYPDSGATLVPSYTQTDVEELAKIMTGWDLKNNRSFGALLRYRGEYASSMVFHPEFHEDESAEGGDGNVTLLGKTIALNSGNDGSALDAALDVLFNHPNIGPYVSRHLITGLVTSNPSSDYVARVASVFNDNGDGVKGDLKAVIYAVLTDVAIRDQTLRSGARFGKFKEPLLVLTHLLRTFSVVPLDGWGSPEEEGVIVNGVYMYHKPQAVLGQAPLRANSVFNFYAPQFIPSDNYFLENALVSPESQIMTEQHQVKLYNIITEFLLDREKNGIGDFTEEVIEGLSKKTMIINFDRELKLFELALDGDENGDFVNMDEVDLETSTLYRTVAIEALLTHLNKILLGDAMTQQFRSTLKSYLLNSKYFERNDNKEVAIRIIREAIRLIATSSTYMVQK